MTSRAPAVPAPAPIDNRAMNPFPRIPGQRLLHSPGPTRLPDEVLQLCPLERRARIPMLAGARSRSWARLNTASA